MQPLSRVPLPGEETPGWYDGVMWTDKPAVAVAAFRGLPAVRLTQEWQVWTFLPATGTPAASWGQEQEWLVLLCQTCCMSAQDSVTHLLAKPSSSRASPDRAPCR